MVELADVVRLYGKEYLEKYQTSILPSHRRALQDILACRTEAMGGHLEECDHCKHLDFYFHSCGNRHCPKCRSHLTQNWLEQRTEELLPIPYFHLVFTLPQPLHACLRSRQQEGYGLLFSAAVAALKNLTAQPRFLGGEIGILAVLHTWGRNLNYHPHLHCLVTGGAWTDKRQWKSADPHFFLPVKLLSKVFREEFKKQFEKTFPDEVIPPQVWQKKWVVYASSVPQGNPVVLNYLGRYLHRVALSNSSIVRMAEGKVTFAYKDSKTKLRRTLTLEAHEFLRRFLQHVLPKGFRKVRYYGLWNPYHHSLLRFIQAMLSYLLTLQSSPLPPSPKARKCPVCQKGRMARCRWLLPIPRGPP